MIRGVDNFKFDIIGGSESPFLGYISSFDKTTLDPRAIIKGSQNVYKTYRKTWASRPGLKRRGSVDTTEAGVKSSYEWVDSTGRTLPLRVCNNKLQVESDIVTEGTYVWYDLLVTSSGDNPAASLTRFSFKPWWDGTEIKDYLIMARGDNKLISWSGGLAKISSIDSASNGVTGVSIGAGGSSFTVGTILEETGLAGTGLQLLVTSVNAGVINGLSIYKPGSGYSTVTNHDSWTVVFGSGSGLVQISITSVDTVYTITKSGTETWAELGFTQSTDNQSIKKIYIGTNEYTYLSGEDTTTLNMGTSNPTGESVGSVAIQSLQLDNSPSTDFDVDFLEISNNQLLCFSLNSRIIYISADTDFSDFTNSGDLIYGDPTELILDEPPTAAFSKGDKVYISGGTSSWYVATLNTPAPVSFSSTYIITKVEKFPSTGLGACKAFEFIDALGDDIIYLDQANQLRLLGIVKDYAGTKNPMLSLPIHDELKNVDFTNGHLRTIDNIVYITSPNDGVHYMYEVRESMDDQGNFIGERFWQPPQVSGIVRFAVIEGVVYGHSVSNPQIYQIWDTNQWYDDSPSGNLPYTCILRFAYRDHGREQGLLYADKCYIEGYMSQGVDLNGYIFLDYKGSTGIKSFTVNSPSDPAVFFIVDPDSLGDEALGGNPLGDGLVEDPTEQETLPKFRAIADLEWTDCFEYALQIYTTSADSRWEILYVGTNPTVSNNQATFIRK